MPTRVRYQQWTRQPQFAAPLNTGSRLATGLSCAFVFHPAFGLRDIVSGLQASFVGAARYVAAAGGMGAGNFASTSDYVALPDLSGVLGPNYTVAWACQNGNTNNQGFGDLSTDTSTEHYPFGSDLYVTGASGSRPLTALSDTSVLLRPHATVVASSTPGSGNNSQLFLAGRKVGSSVPVGTSNSWNPSATLGAGGGFVYSGTFFGFWAWRRQLTDAEAASVSANPWQLFAPRRLLVPVAAGGATQVSVSDSGAGTDTVSATGTTARTDSGAGTDTVSTTGSTARTDSGVGTDSVSTSRAASLSDSGTGTDAVSTTGTASISDSGTGTDAISVDTGSTPISVSDSGTGTDTVSAVVSLSADDSGAGTDTVAAAVALSASDSGIGTDDISVSVGDTPVSLSDSGAGTDTVSAAVDLGAEDSGAGTDVVGFVVKEIGFSDSGSGSDDIIVGKVGGSDAVGGGIAPKRRQRWVLEHRGAIYEFETQNEMREAGAQLLLLEERQAQQQAARAQKRRSKPQKRAQEVVSSLEDVAIEVGATEAVSLATAQEMAALQGLIDAFNAAYNSRQWAQVMDVFQQARERDEEDCLLLLSEFA